MGSEHPGKYIGKLLTGCVEQSGSSMFFLTIEANSTMKYYFFVERPRDMELSMHKWMVERIPFFFSPYLSYLCEKLELSTHGQMTKRMKLSSFCFIYSDVSSSDGRPLDLLETLY